MCCPPRSGGSRCERSRTRSLRRRALRGPGAPSRRPRHRSAPRCGQRHAALHEGPGRRACRRVPTMLDDAHGLGATQVLETSPSTWRPSASAVPGMSSTPSTRLISQACLSARRGEAHAAVAHRDRRDAVQRQRRDDRVPGDLTVEVRVDVDEPRRDDRALGVDHPMRRPGQSRADLGDDPVGHRDVRAPAPGAPLPSTTVPLRMIRSAMSYPPSPRRRCRSAPRRYRPRRSRPQLQVRHQVAGVDQCLQVGRSRTVLDLVGLRSHLDRLPVDLAGRLGSRIGAAPAQLRVTGGGARRRGARPRGHHARSARRRHRCRTGSAS